MFHAHLAKPKSIDKLGCLNQNEFLSMHESYNRVQGAYIFFIS
jgi:hypothetical protein